MSFDVKTSALRRYSNDLVAWSADVSAAETYVDTHARLEWSDAMMFQPVVQVNDQVVKALHDALTRIKQVLAGSATELVGVARLYDETDAAVSERMDRTYEAVRVGPGGGYATHHSRDVDTVPTPPEPPKPPPPESGPPTGTTTPTTAPTTVPTPSPTTPQPSPGPAPSPPTGTTSTTTTTTPTTAPTGPTR